MGKHHSHPRHNYIILQDSGNQHHRIAIIPSGYVMYTGMLAIFFYVMFIISFPATIASLSLQRRILPGSKWMALISSVMSVILYTIRHYLIENQ